MRKTHGLSGKRGYQSWDSMRRRCDDPSHKDYPRYGGRGINYCETWKDFVTFYTDMGEAPPKHSLDRIDGTKGYSKQNCRWATQSQQSRNTGLSRRNSSGCKGVSWQAKQEHWLVSRMLHKNRYTLYWGIDFFEACCAAKSWEARHGRS